MKSFLLAVYFSVGDTVATVVSAPDSGSRGPGLSPGQQGHCVVFLGKTLYSHSTSLHPGVKWVPAKLFGKPDKMLVGNLRRTSIPSRRSSKTPSRFMLQKPG